VEAPAPSFIPSMVAGYCKYRFLAYAAHQYRRTELSHSHSLQAKISHENITISFLRASSRRRYFKISNHTRKETTFRFTVQITRKCAVWVFIRHENQHPTEHTHTHTHTQYIKWNVPLVFFSVSSSLPSRCLTFLFGTWWKTTKIRP
jgi:hypothetical protein